MTPEQKQKLIDQAQQISEESCGEFLCDTCVLKANCNMDTDFADIYARFFLAGIEFGMDQEPVKNPCVECGKEWDDNKIDACPHCGNVVPF